MSFFVIYRTELAAMAKNVPTGPYNDDLFSALNLPMGLLVSFPSLTGLEGAPRGLALLFAACLMVLLAVRIARSLANPTLKAAFASLPDKDAVILIMGAALISGCFLTGQSVGYRGIYLILVIAGMISMRRVADDGPTRSILLNTAIIAVLLMWEGFFRTQVSVLSLNIQFFVWLVKELLWWWLIGQLLGVLAIFGLHSNVFNAISRRPSKTWT